MNWHKIKEVGHESLIEIGSVAIVLSIGELIGVTIFPALKNCFIPCYFVIRFAFNYFCK